MTTSSDHRRDRDRDLQEAFNRINADGSGHISKKDLWRSLQNSSVTNGSFYGESKGELNNLFDALDVDKSGTVDFREYSSFMNRMMSSISGRSVGGNNTPPKSCMKVSTLADSLESCNKKKPSKKERRVRTSFFVRGNGRSRSENQDLLDSMHSQKSNLRACRQLSIEESIKLAVATMSHNVRFFDVEVRSYEVTVSDNPGVSCGAALELGWNFNILSRTDLDAFEAKRATERSQDFRHEKRLNALDRHRILRELGASKKEIRDAAKQAALLRSKRKKSIEQQHLDKKHESLEKCKRGFKRVFSSLRGSSKRRVEGEIVDMERLHPTLMVLVGLDGSIHSLTSEQSQGSDVARQ